MTASPATIEASTLKPFGAVLHGREERTGNKESRRGKLRRGAAAAALMGVVVLTLTACERPFTRDEALAVPHSAIQVGEYRDKDWEYVDENGVRQKLNRCDDLSPWTTAYSCTSPVGSVRLTFSHGKRGGMKNVILHTSDEDVLLDCINDGSWDNRRFCMPISATPGATQSSASGTP